MSYQCAQYLATVLSRLIGKSEHLVRNSKDFAKELRKLKITSEEELRSYNVSALFTRVPVAIKDRLANIAPFSHVSSTG